MAREDKIQLMEALWVDLSRDEETILSPAWHEDALKNAEQKHTSGETTALAWNTAKNNLRTRFE